MRIGIIAEFNPLHSGHKYIIESAKNLILENGTGEIVCVMSEFFTQRGEVAILNGYLRAKEAILTGCDLVIALPYQFSVSYSDYFAYKSVKILNECGITHLIFGTEYDIDIFESIYIKEQQNGVKEKIKKYIKEGYSYPKIMNLIFGIENNSPNFILAYSYFKAIKKINSNIKLIPIKREGQTLNDSNLENKKYLSATAIRNNINSSEISNYLSFNMYNSLLENEKLSEQKFYNFLKYKIISMGEENIKNIYDVSEGLENRIYEKNLQANSYNELVDLVSSKRYSKKRIQRIFLHILTDTKKENILEEITNFRVLAINKNKTSLIREINNNGNIKLHQKLNRNNNKFFENDIKVSRIYNMLSNGKDIFKENILLVNVKEK